MADKPHDKIILTFPNKSKTWIGQVDGGLPNNPVNAVNAALVLGYILYLYSY